MKIAVINGSQKSGASNTGIILRELNRLLEKEHEVSNYVSGIKQFSPEAYKTIVSSEAVVFAFPLYNDSVPSNVITILIELEKYFRVEGKKDVWVYTIINNGFYEGRQTHIAFEIIRNWCVHAGTQFGGGIGQGAGEMIGSTASMPFAMGPFANLENALKRLVQTIGLKEIFSVLFLSPCFPRFLWRFMATQTFWLPRARKNGLRKKDIAVECIR